LTFLPDQLNQANENERVTDLVLEIIQIGQFDLKINEISNDHSS